VAYLKATALAVVGALLIGAATATWSIVQAAFAALRPEDKATVLSRSISEGMNCAAFYLSVLVPLGLVVAYVLRRRKRT
jgi:hypothetical protein